MMTCQSFQECLSAYLDRELPEKDTELMAAHAESCPRCRKERTRGVEMKGILRQRSMPGLPPELFAAIEEKTVLRRVWWEADAVRVRWLPALVGLATALGALWLSRLQERI